MKLSAEWYGIPFGVTGADGKFEPVPIPKWRADLIIWQRHREEPYVRFKSAFLNPVHEHYLQALRDLYRPSQLKLHSWFESMAEAYTNNTGIILLGGGSTGKSHFAGLAFLSDLMADLGNVYCCMVSTSKGALMQRSLASAIEYLNCLKANGINPPLKFVSQKFAIVPETATEDLQGIKSMIKGVAINEGTEQDAKSSVIGVHLPRVRSCADEFENMGDRSKAFIAAQANLQQGCHDYKMVLCFNPQSLNSPGCVMAAPDRAGGWASLNPDEDTKWVTKEGRAVLRFDALKSPGLTNPDLSFLPTKESIDRTLKDYHGNWDHPDVWAMIRGFPPMSSVSGTVLTDAEVLAFKALESETWRGENPPMLIGGLDPAFTSDGDNCVLQLADVGHSVDGTLRMQCRDPMYLKIEASSPVPIVYQIVGQLKKIVTDTKLDLCHLAIDDSGTQSVADVVAKELGGGSLRVVFNARASDYPVSMANNRPASKQWGNSVTELWVCLAELVRYGQIRRLPEAAVAQFTRRRYNPNRYPRILEPKKVFKARTGLNSPDEADAVSLCVAVARFVLGVQPGASVLDPRGTPIVYAPSPVDVARIMAVNNLKSTYGVRF